MMCRSFVYVVAATLLCASGVFAEYEEEDGVLVLTDDNFKQAVKEFDYLLAEFYAPWCGHCKSLAPEYAEAAASLKESEIPVVLAKVDATVHEATAAAYTVESYPTLKFFKRGVVQDYEGGRIAGEIVEWVISKSKNAAETIGDIEDVNSFFQNILEEGGEGEAENASKWAVTVLGIFDDLGGAEAQLIEKLAGEDDTAHYAITSLAAAKELYNVEGERNIIIQRKFEEPSIVKYEGDYTEKDLGVFISVNEYPLVQEFDVEHSSLFGSKIPGHIFMFISGADEGFDSSLTMFKSSAATWKGQMHLVYINVDGEEDQAALLEYFDIEQSDLPALRLIARHPTAEEFLKFAPDDKELSEANIAQFAQKYLDGELKPTLKSEAVEEGWNKSPVWVLSGTNHDEVVKDAKLNVFVEYYAPWCGHCKQLAPIWENLGDEYEDVDNVVIAKMDATANEVEGLKVEGFPTLKFYAAGSDEAVDYVADRDLPTLVEFVLKNGEGVTPSELSAAKTEVRDAKKLSLAALNDFFANPTAEGNVAITEANEKVLQAHEALQAKIAANRAAKKGHDEL